MLATVPWSWLSVAPGSESPACFILPNSQWRQVLGLPLFPMRHLLALFLPALGHCTMVNRFFPPFTGLGILGLCPALHSAQLHPVVLQTQKKKKKSRNPSSDPLNWEWAQTAESPRAALLDNKKLWVVETFLAEHIISLKPNRSQTECGTWNFLPMTGWVPGS